MSGLIATPTSYLPGNHLSVDILTAERLDHGVLTAFVQVVVVEEHVVVRATLLQFLLQLRLQNIHTHRGKSARVRLKNTTLPGKVSRNEGSQQKMNETRHRPESSRNSLHHTHASSTHN